jgi:hypothetical protein
MVWAAYTCGLFRLRYWIASRDVLFCAIALCLAFVPFPLAVRLASWACIAGFVGWLFIKRKETRIV